MFGPNLGSLEMTEVKRSSRKEHEKVLGGCSGTQNPPPRQLESFLPSLLPALVLAPLAGHPFLRS